MFKLKSLNQIFGLLLLFGISTLNGCVMESKSNIIVLLPNDESEAITIFSDYSANRRTIAVGRHSIKPKSDYILLDISNIREDGDTIGVCWKKNGHNWEMVNNNAKVIEVKLDTSKYVFRENWYRDERGIHNSLYYEEVNCFIVGALDFSKPYPKENGRVVRK